MYKVSKEQLIDVVNVLKRLPYENVARVIAILSNLPPLEVPKPEKKQDKQPDKK